MDQILRDGFVTDRSPVMTVRDLAALLKVNEKTVYRLAQRGDLPGFKVAGAWRFQIRDIDGWIEQRKRDRNQQRGGV